VDHTRYPGTKWVLLEGLFVTLKLKFSMIYSIHSQGQADTSAKTFTPNVRSEEISHKDLPQVPGNLL
jgi:hypothetical protein